MQEIRTGFHLNKIYLCRDRFIDWHRYVTHEASLSIVRLLISLAWCSLFCCAAVLQSLAKMPFLGYLFKLEVPRTASRTFCMPIQCSTMEVLKTQLNLTLTPSSQQTKGLHDLSGSLYLERSNGNSMWGIQFTLDIFTIPASDQPPREA